jgi:hypothetical protein
LSREVHFDARFAHRKPFQGGFALQLLYNAKNGQTVQTAKPARLRKKSRPLAPIAGRKEADAEQQGLANRAGVYAASISRGTRWV